MMNLEEIKDKRIAVLLSGGVDSSVVVYEFARLGLHPDCFYIKIGPEEHEEWNCSSEEDLEWLRLWRHATVASCRWWTAPRVLGPGDALYHGEGEGGLHAQP